MDSGAEFVDLYATLGVEPDCDGKALELAYRKMAKRFHPDHPDTADADRFHDTIAAYRVLRDGPARQDYDIEFARRFPRRPRFPSAEELGIDGATAQSDGEIHEKILLYLYKRRRERASDPGVIAFLLQEMLGCSDEHFEFHVWYLKSKGHVVMTEQGTLAITIDGVDEVIASSRSRQNDKLLTSRTRPPQA